jgi:K+-sensing histidine kinase KdpD
MGLGLSLVQSIVESHFGKVWVESEEDVGSTFFVWLPSRNTDLLGRAGEEPSARLDTGRAPEKAGQEAS